MYISKEEIVNIFGLAEPWSLLSILEESKKGLDLLLHQYNYDGTHWEESQHCLEKISDYEKRINEFLVNYFNKIEQI